MYLASLGPAGLDMAGLGPAGMSPAGMGPAGMGSASLGPAGDQGGLVGFDALLPPSSQRGMLLGVLHMIGSA